MSKVNKLLAKALSTSSEDEAMSALRLARKQYEGGEINLQSNAEVEYWKKIARDLQMYAREYKRMYEDYRSKYLTRFSDSAITDIEMSRLRSALQYEKQQTKGLKKKLDDQKRFNMFLTIAAAALILATVVITNI